MPEPIDGPGPDQWPPMDPRAGARPPGPVPSAPGTPVVAPGPVLAPPRPGPPLWLGIVLVGVGLLALVVSVLPLSGTSSGSDAGAVVTAPSRALVPLEGNRTYRIAIDDPDLSGTRPAPSLEVTDPSGAPVRLYDAPEGIDPYLHDVVTFVTPQAGTYTVVAGDPPDGRPMRLVVGEPTSTSEWWVLLFVLGGFAVLAGAVVLVVGSVRRRSARAAWGPPDPGRVAR